MLFCPSDFESKATHAGKVGLDLLLALLVGFGRVKPEEAIVPCRLCLWASAASGTFVKAANTQLKNMAYGFNPFGFRGFIFGLVGSYGHVSATGEDGDHQEII